MEAWFKSDTWHLYSFPREIVVTARISLAETVPFVDFAVENCKDEFRQNEPCRDFQYLWVEVVGGTTQKVFQIRQNTQAREPIAYDLTGLQGKRITVRFGVYNIGSGGKTVLYADEAGVEICTP